MPRTALLLAALTATLAACATMDAPASGTRLQPVEVGGRRFWVTPGPLVTEAHPCCGEVPRNPDREADAEAVCPPLCAAGLAAGDEGCACPPGTTALRPGLADDKVCGAPSRCLRLPELQVVGASPITDLTTGTSYPVGADWAVADPDPAGVITVSVPDGTVARLLASPGWRYRVVTDEGEVTAITRVGRVPPRAR